MVRIDTVVPFVFSSYLLVLEQDCRSTALEAPPICTDVKEGSSSGFGPLKSLLEAISIAYANREVSP